MKKQYKTKIGNRTNALAWYYKHKTEIRAKANAFRADPKNKRKLHKKDKKYRNLPTNKKYQQGYHKKRREEQEEAFHNEIAQRFLKGKIVKIGPDALGRSLYRVECKDI